MRSFKAGLAHNQLVWFVVLALLPATVVRLPLVAHQRYDDALELLTYCLSGLVAILLCWAADGGQRLARQRRKRLLVFALVSLLAGLVVALVVPRQEATFGPAYRGAYLLLAVMLGYLVSCLWSPVTAVRDLVRPLLSWRLSWDRYAFALLVWPLVGAATLVVSGLLGPRSGYQPGGGARLGDIPGVLEASLTVLIYAVPHLVGWYGFAARRLLVRHSPLAVALLVGVLLAVPGSLGLLFVLPSLAALNLVGSLADAVIVVWLFDRCDGGLLPLVLMAAMGTFSSYAEGRAEFRLGIVEGVTVSVVVVCVLAVALILSYRMWHQLEPRIDPQAVSSLAS